MAQEILTIRAADAVLDFPYILSCGRNAWIAVYGNDRKFNPDFFRNNSQSILRHRSDNIYLAFDSTGNHAGIVILDSRVRDEDAVGHISLLYLEEAYRGRGLGAQLIGHAEDVCRARGLKTMRLYVSISNRRARSFYEKQGYEKYGAQLPVLSGQFVLRKAL